MVVAAAAAVAAAAEADAAAAAVAEAAAAAAAAAGAAAAVAAPGAAATLAWVSGWRLGRSSFAGLKWRRWRRDTHTRTRTTSSRAGEGGGERGEEGKGARGRGYGKGGGGERAPESRERPVETHRERTRPGGPDAPGRPRPPGGAAARDGDRKTGRARERKKGRPPAWASRGEARRRRLRR